LEEEKETSLQMKSKMNLLEAENQEMSSKVKTLLDDITERLRLKEADLAIKVNLFPEPSFPI